MKSILALILSCFLSITLVSQTSLRGKVTDEKTGEELIGANVVLYKNGVLIDGAVVDLNGEYSTNLDPGTYEAKVSYIGYETKENEKIVVNAGKKNELNIELCQGIDLPEIVVIAYGMVSKETRVCICGYALEVGEDTRVIPPIEPLPVLELETLETYPNPAVSNLNIQISQDVDYLILRNINGQEVMQQNNISKGLSTIDVSAFVAGTYVVQVVKGSVMISKKVMVVKM